MGIEPSRVIQTLTSGLVIRLNPTNLSHQTQVVEFVEKRFVGESASVFCIVGAELISNSAASTRTGHSFSLINIKKSNNKIYIRIRNSLPSIGIDRTLFVPDDDESTNDGVYLFELSNFFKYFEVFTCLLLASNGDLIRKLNHIIF